MVAFPKTNNKDFLQSSRNEGLGYLESIYQFLAGLLKKVLNIWPSATLYELKRNNSYLEDNSLTDFCYKNMLIRANKNLDIYLQLPVSKGW